MTVTEHTIDSSEPVATPAPAAVADQDELIEDEVLVEEISIDGMCGVY